MHTYSPFLFQIMLFYMKDKERSIEQKWAISMHIIEIITKYD